MKVLRRSQVPTLAIWACLFTVGILAGPVAAWRYAAPLARAPRLALELVTTTFEERRISAYGYCEPLGLGYLEDVLRGFPDPRAMPLVRHGDWEHGVGLLLPERRDRTEERVLVGIGVGPVDFAPTLVGLATFRGGESDGDSVVDHWTFRTQRDIELLLGIVVRMGEGETGAPMDLRVRLVESPKSARILAEWEHPVPAGHRGEIRLPLAEPIERFSVNRGATDFLLEVRRPAWAPRAEGIVAIGSRLNGIGWTVAATKGRCLVAMRDDLLAEAARDPEGPWARFLRMATHARPR